MGSNVVESAVAVVVELDTDTAVVAVDTVVVVVDTVVVVVETAVVELQAGLVGNNTD